MGTDTGRPFACVAAAVLLAGFAVAAAAGPATAPADAARLARATRVHAVLADALDSAFAHGGRWPDRPTPDDPALDYARPPTAVDAVDAEVVGPATVVVTERLDRHPDGVWVGYADGHLEFAADAAAVAACAGQVRIARSAAAVERPTGAAILASKTTTRPTTTRPTTAPAPTGSLTLRVVDPAGRPAGGVTVGTKGSCAAKLAAWDHRGGFWKRGQSDAAVTDADGRVTLAAGRVFTWDVRCDAAESAVLWFVHDGRDLVALETVRPTDFAADAAAVPRTVRLAPACHAHVDCGSVGSATPVARNAVVMSRPGLVPLWWKWSDVDAAANDLLLPPGDVELDVTAAGVVGTRRYVHVDPGCGAMTIALDLTPTAAVRSVGRPAPPLGPMKGWKNTAAPIALAGLRGRVVVLDFWGYWCGPCVGRMPDLMRLADRYKGRDLTVVAVHDATANSVADMDAHLTLVRQKLWGGRDLPFPVCVDGGGPTRVPGSARILDGATGAAYGIQQYPTTVVIDRDGTLVWRDDVDLPQTSLPAVLTRLLGPPPATGPAASGPATVPAR